MIPEAFWSEWVPLRALLVLAIGWGLVAIVYLALVNFEVLEARALPKKGTESWDWLWAVVFTLLLWATFWVGWPDADAGQASLPRWTWMAGVVLFVLGSGLFTRAAGENPFFEKTVRIQTERGHRVIDTGPYRVVRHPGYVGLFLVLFSLPPLLTSAWAFVPAILSAIALVVRTTLEDRTLHEKLPGYAEYAQRVRSRLIPGVW